MEQTIISLMNEVHQLTEEVKNLKHTIKQMQHTPPTSKTITAYELWEEECVWGDYDDSDAECGLRNVNDEEIRQRIIEHMLRTYGVLIDPEAFTYIKNEGNVTVDNIQVMCSLDYLAHVYAYPEDGRFFKEFLESVPPISISICHNNLAILPPFICQWAKTLPDRYDDEDLKIDISIDKENIKISGGLNIFEMQQMPKFGDPSFFINSCEIGDRTTTWEVEEFWYGKEWIWSDTPKCRLFGYYGDLWKDE